MPEHKADQRQSNADGRWASVDSYLVCISECDLNDGSCMTRCMEVHLKAEEPATHP